MANSETVVITRSVRSVERDLDCDVSLEKSLLSSFSSTTGISGEFQYVHKEGDDQHHITKKPTPTQRYTGIHRGLQTARLSETGRFNPQGVNLIGLCYRFGSRSVTSS